MAMTLRLTEEQDRALQKLADARDVSKQDAAVWAIEQQSERLGVAGDVKQWADHALDRYEDLLARLAR